MVSWAPVGYRRGQIWGWSKIKIGDIPHTLIIYKLFLEYFRKFIPKVKEFSTNNVDYV